MVTTDSPVTGAGVGFDRASVLTYVVLLGVAGAAWLQVVRAALRPDPMAGMDMPMPLAVGDALVFVAGWTVMMTAMMLPSALPMIALFAATRPTAAGRPVRGAAVTGFTLVYLGLWALSGVPIYLADVTLGSLPASVRSYTVAGMLVTAGAFQLSSLKQTCLRNCRSPLGFFLGRWRPGWRGALALGRAHALYCLGCCWALMVTLVVAGAMGLAWVLLVAAVVAAEKLLPHGAWIARAVGIVFVVLGLAVAAQPHLAATLRGVGPTT